MSSRPRCKSAARRSPGKNRDPDLDHTRPRRRVKPCIVPLEIRRGRRTKSRRRKPLARDASPQRALSGERPVVHKDGIVRRRYAHAAQLGRHAVERAHLDRCHVRKALRAVIGVTPRTVLDPPDAIRNVAQFDERCPLRGNRCAGLSEVVPLAQPGQQHGAAICKAIGNNHGEPCPGVMPYACCREAGAIAIRAVNNRVNRRILLQRLTKGCRQRPRGARMQCSGPLLKAMRG